MAMLLSLTGNEAHAAYDGPEAVDAAARLRPDVILLDIGLPKMNGYEAARIIRKRPWGKKMVLLALTGWGQDVDRRSEGPTPPWSSLRTMPSSRSCWRSSQAN